MNINWLSKGKNWVAAGLFVLFVQVFLEARNLWLMKPNLEKLLSPAGAIAISLYVPLFLTGIWCLLLGIWWTDGLYRVAARLERSVAFRWLTVVGLLLLITWIYLYSPWQDTLPGPWTQMVFAGGVAQIILLLAAPHRDQKFGWTELVLTLAIFLYPRIVHEVRVLTPVALVYRSAAAGGLILALGLIVLLYRPMGERVRVRLIRFRERLGMARWIAAAALCLLPLFYRYMVGPETYILYNDLRFAVWLAALWAAACFASTGAHRLVSREALGVGLGVLILVLAVTDALLMVVDDPFSLTWSEGNRFYDYSLVFGQSLYNYAGYIVNPYSLPGRYGLWGVLFLWEGLPIWVHRLWNKILLILPALIFAARMTWTLKPPALRYGMRLWIALFFIVLAPLHPPFMLVSIMAVWFAFDASPLKRGAALAVAGFYAGLSRWTWAFAPGALGALIDLSLYYPKRQGTLLRRLAPTIVLTALGVLPGLVQSLGAFRSTLGGESLTSQQPLLWYRLLPNETLGPGVLLLALLTTTPLLLLLIWWMRSGRWQLDWIQKTAIWGAVTGFFAVGLLISTKIGGGGDLHNLDMYLVTLIVTIMLGLVVQTQGPEEMGWPPAVIGLVVWSVFLVVYPFTPLSPRSSSSPWLDLPEPDQVTQTLSIVQAEVERASTEGEILFMDQRQLLTFGYVEAIPFVPEYEKKYMMDQAMANNAAYFQPYYMDLANRRFALIVTEPLRTRRKEEMGGPFSEENDAWVTWVSNPTLCFYEPIYTFKDTNVQLLVPRTDAVGCEQFMQP